MIIIQSKLKGIKEFITGTRLVFFVRKDIITEDIKMQIEQSNGNEGWLTFSRDELKAGIEKIMKDRKVGASEKGRSKSELMRGELYRYWMNGYKGQKIFEEFYRDKMDDYITKIKQVNDQLEIEKMDEDYSHK